MVQSQKDTTVLDRVLSRIASASAPQACRDAPDRSNGTAVKLQTTASRAGIQHTTRAATSASRDSSLAGTMIQPFVLPKGILKATSSLQLAISSTPAAGNKPEPEPRSLILKQPVAQRNGGSPGAQLGRHASPRGSANSPRATRQRINSPRNSPSRGLVAGPTASDSHMGQAFRAEHSSASWAGAAGAGGWRPRSGSATITRAAALRALKQQRSYSPDRAQGTSLSGAQPEASTGHEEVMSGAHKAGEQQPIRAESLVGGEVPASGAPAGHRREQGSTANSRAHPSSSYDAGCAVGSPAFRQIQSDASGSRGRPTSVGRSPSVPHPAMIVRPEQHVCFTSPPSNELAGPSVGVGEQKTGRADLDGQHRRDETAQQRDCSRLNHSDSHGSAQRPGGQEQSSSSSSIGAEAPKAGHLRGPSSEGAAEFSEDQQCAAAGPLATCASGVAQRQQRAMQLHVQRASNVSPGRGAAERHAAPEPSYAPAPPATSGAVGVAAIGDGAAASGSTPGPGGKVPINAGVVAPATGGASAAGAFTAGIVAKAAAPAGIAATRVGGASAANASTLAGLSAKAAGAAAPQAAGPPVAMASWKEDAMLAAKSKIQRLEEQVKDLSLQLADSLAARADALFHADEAASSTRQAAQLGEQQQALHNRVAEMNEQLQKARAANEALTAQNKALYGTLDETLSAAEHAAQELKQLRATTAQLQAAQQDAEKQVTQLQEEVALRDGAMAAVQAEFNALRRRHEDAMSSMEATRRDSALREARLRREVEVTQQEVAAVQQQLAKLQREHQQLHARKAEKDKQLAALARKAEQQAEQLAKEQRVATEQAGLVRELESRATLLRNRNATLDKALASEKEARQAAKEQVRQLEEEIAVLVSIVRQSDPSLEMLSRYQTPAAAAAAAVADALSPMADDIVMAAVVPAASAAGQGHLGRESALGSLPGNELQSHEDGSASAPLATTSAAAASSTIRPVPVHQPADHEAPSSPSASPTAILYPAKQHMTGGSFHERNITGGARPTSPGSLPLPGFYGAGTTPQGAEAARKRAGAAPDRHSRLPLAGHRSGSTGRYALRHEQAHREPAATAAAERRSRTPPGTSASRARYATVAVVGSSAAGMAAASGVAASEPTAYSNSRAGAPSIYTDASEATGPVEVPEALPGTRVLWAQLQPRKRSSGGGSGASRGGSVLSATRPASTERSYAAASARRARATSALTAAAVTDTVALVRDTAANSRTQSRGASAGDASRPGAPAARRAKTPEPMTSLAWAQLAEGSGRRRSLTPDARPRISSVGLGSHPAWGPPPAQPAHCPPAPGTASPQRRSDTMIEVARVLQPRSPNAPARLWDDLHGAKQPSPSSLALAAAAMAAAALARGSGGVVGRRAVGFAKDRPSLQALFDQSSAPTAPAPALPTHAETPPAGVQRRSSGGDGHPSLHAVSDGGCDDSSPEQGSPIVLARSYYLPGESSSGEGGDRSSRTLDAESVPGMPAAGTNANFAAASSSRGTIDLRRNQPFRSSFAFDDSPPHAPQQGAQNTNAVPLRPSPQQQSAGHPAAGGAATGLPVPDAGAARAVDVGSGRLASETSDLANSSSEAVIRNLQQRRIKLMQDLSSGKEAVPPGPAANPEGVALYVPHAQTALSESVSTPDGKRRRGELDDIEAPVPLTSTFTFQLPQNAATGSPDAADGAEPGAGGAGAGLQPASDGSLHPSLSGSSEASGVGGNSYKSRFVRPRNVTFADAPITYPARPAQEGSGQPGVDEVLHIQSQAPHRTHAVPTRSPQRLGPAAAGDGPLQALLGELQSDSGSMGSIWSAAPSPAREPAARSAGPVAGRTDTSGTAVTQQAQALGPQTGCTAVGESAASSPSGKRVDPVVAGELVSYRGGKVLSSVTEREWSDGGGVRGESLGDAFAAGDDEEVPESADEGEDEGAGAAGEDDEGEDEGDEYADEEGSEEGEEGSGMYGTEEDDEWEEDESGEEQRGEEGETEEEWSDEEQQDSQGNSHTGGQPQSFVSGCGEASLPQHAADATASGIINSGQGLLSHDGLDSPMLSHASRGALATLSFCSDGASASPAARNVRLGVSLYDNAAFDADAHHLPADMQLALALERAGQARGAGSAASSPAASEWEVQDRTLGEQRPSEGQLPQPAEGHVVVPTSLARTGGATTGSPGGSSALAGEESAARAAWLPLPACHSSGGTASSSAGCSPLETQGDFGARTSDTTRAAFMGASSGTYEILPLQGVASTAAPAPGSGQGGAGTLSGPSATAGGGLQSLAASIAAAIADWNHHHGTSLDDPADAAASQGALAQLLTSKEQGPEAVPVRIASPSPEPTVPWSFGSVGASHLSMPAGPSMLSSAPQPGPQPTTARSSPALWNTAHSEAGSQPRLGSTGLHHWNPPEQQLPRLGRSSLPIGSSGAGSADGGGALAMSLGHSSTRSLGTVSGGLAGGMSPRPGSTPALLAATGGAVASAEASLAMSVLPRRPPSPSIKPLNLNDVLRRSPSAGGTAAR